MDEIAGLLKLLDETQDRLHRALGLAPNEWRQPEDYTTRFWALVGETIYWSDDPFSLESIKAQESEPYSSPAYGKGPKVVRNYTVVEIDYEQGGDFALAVFANNKQCKDKVMLEFLADM